MKDLYVVGGGLFGSMAAVYARRRGIAVTVFDAGLEGAASPCAAGLFHERWAGRKLREHYEEALPVLDQMYGLSRVTLEDDRGQRDTFHFVPPRLVLEADPVRQRVTAIGDGWLEAGGRRYEGGVYIAAGIWSEQFLPGLGVYGKAGAAYLFAGETTGRIEPIAYGRQALRFVRDPGTTYFSDGTAERDYHGDHDRQTLERAAIMGLTGEPLRRLWGWRPYVSGGPVFRRIGERTWVATGGRKMGTILAASFARRLIEDERW